MRIFVTGATGFVGTAVVQELINAGHQVLGLARNDAAAAALVAAGVEVHRGDLEDLDSLRRGAAAADGVIHTGFIHDFSRFKEVCEVDRRAITALGAALVGSDKPFIVTSGTALLKPGHLVTEDTISTTTVNDMPRVATQEAVDALVAQGVRAVTVRLSPSVHGDGDKGFVPMLINIARQQGVSAYVGDGGNRWNAVHRLDAARVFRLALENPTLRKSFHAVAEEAVLLRDIAAIIGRRLNLPVVSKSGADVAAHFGWFAHFAQIDCPASSQLTRELLGWQPTQPGLLADLDRPSYFAA